MMRHQLLTYLPCLSMMLVGACGREPDLALDLTTLGKITPNDSFTNGLTANGLTANGYTANGYTANGYTANGYTANGAELSTDRTFDPTQLRLNDLANISFHSLSLNGQPIESATINGSTIEGRQGLAVLTGRALISAKMRASLLDGMPVTMQVADVQVRDGITLYSIAVLTDSGPVPMCGLSNGAPIPAIAVQGYWDRASAYVADTASFTFGCINAAIGKCTLWGYQPWSTTQECRNNSCRTRQLSDWMHACVRMVRADYCGNGISHTRSGTLINVYDQLGLQASSDPGWAIEAEWRMDGASCINHTRWVKADLSWNETDLEYVQRVCPSRLSASSNGNKCEPDKSTYNTQFGFNKDTDERPLVRNESPQYQ